MNEPRYDSTNITGFTSLRVHEMPMVVSSAGTKLPNDGFTITIGTTCSWVQETPIAFPSVGTKLPKLGLTRTMGTTFSLGQACVSWAQAKDGLRLTTLNTPIAIPTRTSDIRVLISLLPRRIAIKPIHNVIYRCTFLTYCDFGT